MHSDLRRKLMMCESSLYTSDYPVANIKYQSTHLFVFILYMRRWYICALWEMKGIEVYDREGSSQGEIFSTTGIGF